ncbi:putative lipoprotein [Neorickettsia sennetsu str. Miyayama]|uniref:Lipoprotein n=1 Tax=Ehrlichia sennetsu (strain ATCC VR-367 / Miyayama) TaxID=222891 RepID=Q2GE46_EHRS3|nr:putative lipoprotein [Neorickettsia sennetsu str. Miyayama]
MYASFPRAQSGYSFVLLLGCFGLIFLWVSDVLYFCSNFFCYRKERGACCMQFYRLCVLGVLQGGINLLKLTFSCEA